MFEGAWEFNHPIGNWEVSSVTNMSFMFKGAQKFNHPINDWNTSSVTTVRDMFHSAFAFNQDLSDWNVSAVTNMTNIFLNTNALSDVNKGLIHGTFSSNSNWPYDWSAHVPAPASLTNANFQTAVDLWCSDKTAAFATYGHIKDWNVTGVTSMNEAFKDKTTFDENITGWDVSNVQCPVQSPMTRGKCCLLGACALWVVVREDRGNTELGFLESRIVEVYRSPNMVYSERSRSVLH